MYFDVIIKKRLLPIQDRKVFGYVYRIKDLKLNKSYIGIRYKEGINIHQDLGVAYFTSSKGVKRLLEINQNNRQRFVFEIRKIFYYPVTNVLLDYHKAAIMGLYREERKSLKLQICNYEKSLLKKLKAGTNPRLMNLVHGDNDWQHYKAFNTTKGH